MKKPESILPVTAVTVLLMILSACAYAAPPKTRSETTPGPTAIVDGRPVILTEPIMCDGSPLVWVRDLEKLGWGQMEKQDDGSVALKHGAMTITFSPGKATALVNKLPVDLATVPIVVSGRLMVPLEFVCQTLGYSYSLTMQPVVKITSKPEAAATPKKLVIELPEKVKPEVTVKPLTGSNRIIGSVIYAAAPAAGIRLRLITPGEQLQFVKGQVATSDRQGQYVFGGVADGKYRVYAYVADNPGYFNRMSDVVAAEGGAEKKVANIEMGRVLQPMSPRVGGRVVPVNARLSLICSTCPLANYYEFAVLNVATGKTVATSSSSRPTATIEVTSLEGSGEFQWQVKAYDEKDNFIGGSPGAGGQPWTFKLAGR